MGNRLATLLNSLDLYTQEKLPWVFWPMILFFGLGIFFAIAQDNPFSERLKGLQPKLSTEQVSVLLSVALVGIGVLLIPVLIALLLQNDWILLSELILAPLYVRITIRCSRPQKK